MVDLSIYWGASKTARGFELMTYGIQDDAANDCANETDMLNFDILIEQVCLVVN